MQKRTTVVDRDAIRVVIVTMDSHLSSATERAARLLQRECPSLEVVIHAAESWSSQPAALERCLHDIAAGHIILATMLFMEDHFMPVLEALRARRDDCQALICAMSAGEVVRLTRMGQFAMGGGQSGPLALLKRLRGKSGKDGGSSGAQQMRMLRRIPRLLRFIPGTAQDVRAYFLTLQYWLAGSEDNLTNMLRFLVGRYAPPAHAAGLRKAAAPIDYPEVGLYHPRLTQRFSTEARSLPKGGKAGTVGLLMLRSYLLSGNCRHYDGVIAALEARGLSVLPAFAAGLDARPAIEQYFMKNGRTQIDALVSLTGFSLVGGPAYNDARAAEEILARLDVPFVAAHPVEFQTIEEWEGSDRGLLPVEATIMEAIPELDGGTAPMVFGGRSAAVAEARDMIAHPERAATLAARVENLVRLRRSKTRERKVGIVIFNFPPNGGNTGTAAYLAVFESLYATLAGLKEQGYEVELPDSSDSLRTRLLEGNSARYGAPANVYKRVSANEHVECEPHLDAIEKQWGAAPGKHQSDGSSIFVLGERFGNVFIGVQPSFGYEGDPMRLLFEKGFAPTHAFAAFYRFLRDDFGAHAILHFGTHGALEFMPGKQSGMSGDCWPERLIGTVPNFYLYASNNPSEGSIAKRRCAATLISYLTPALTEAGLYRGLADLRQSIDGFRACSDDLTRRAMAELVQSQAAALEIVAATPPWSSAAAEQIERLRLKIMEIESTLIPHGLHVIGRGAEHDQRIDLLKAAAESFEGSHVSEAAVQGIVADLSPQAALVFCGPKADAATLQQLQTLQVANQRLKHNGELVSLLHALDGRFTPPAPGGDVIRNLDVLPTGRNLHGFDPFRIPSAFAVADGARQAEAILKRHLDDGHRLPECVGLVLWGSDNLKTEGGPVGQALALLGAKPRFDSYGRIAGATLIPLDQLARPRIDVMLTLSGIFRDLLPLQIKLLAEAAFLAASAEEPEHLNFVRKHSLAYMQSHGCDLETAALRVFGNAESSYGANVNHLIESSRWDNGDELAETYTRRKGFAYGRSGRAVRHSALLSSILSNIDLTYQNLESVEVGVTSVDTYFDTLGGINRAIRRAADGKAAPPVYIADQTRGGHTVRSLSEQVELESRTRTLNPKWYEGMLEHGYEGVRQIETHLTNTMGWSATTGEVQPWIYQQITETFILDEAMRNRLAKLNPTASAKMASRLLEASERQFWRPDSRTLKALQSAGEELEERVEGIFHGVAA